MQCYSFILDSAAGSATASEPLVWREARVLIPSTASQQSLHKNNSVWVSSSAHGCCTETLRTRTRIFLQGYALTPRKGEKFCTDLAESSGTGIPWMLYRKPYPHPGIFSTEYPCPGVRPYVRLTDFTKLPGKGMRVSQNSQNCRVRGVPGYIPRVYKKSYPTENNLEHIHHICYL